MNKIFYALPCILLIAIANTVLKSRTDYLAQGSDFLPFQSFARLFTDPGIIIAAFLTAISIFWWLYVSPGVDISILYPALQGGVILATIIMSNIFLGESLTGKKIAASLVIVAGIYLLSTSYRE